MFRLHRVCKAVAGHVPRGAVMRNIHPVFACARPVRRASSHWDKVHIVSLPSWCAIHPYRPVTLAPRDYAKDMFHRRASILGNVMKDTPLVKVPPRQVRSVIIRANLSEERRPRVRRARTIVVPPHDAAIFSPFAAWKLVHLAQVAWVAKGRKVHHTNFLVKARVQQQRKDQRALDWRGHTRVVLRDEHEGRVRHQLEGPSQPFHLQPTRGACMQWNEAWQ